MSSVIFLFCFVIRVFFFKQKTAYEMRISDWSSDVCSSDLVGELRRGLCGGGDGLRMDALALHLRDAHGVHADPDDDGQDDHREGGKEDGAGHGRQIGRASCRERVCQYV